MRRLSGRAGVPGRGALGEQGFRGTGVPRPGILGGRGGPGVSGALGAQGARGPGLLGRAGGPEVGRVLGCRGTGEWGARGPVRSGGGARGRSPNPRSRAAGSPRPQRPARRALRVQRRKRSAPTRVEKHRAARAGLGALTGACTVWPKFTRGPALARARTTPGARTHGPASRGPRRALHLSSAGRAERGRHRPSGRAPPSKDVAPQRQQDRGRRPAPTTQAPPRPAAPPISRQALAFPQPRLSARMRGGAYVVGAGPRSAGGRGLTAEGAFWVGRGFSRWGRACAGRGSFPRRAGERRVPHAGPAPGVGATPIRPPAHSPARLRAVGVSQCPGRQRRAAMAT